jgi:drug/metabolite transporter (DMT)-like permease
MLELDPSVWSFLFFLVFFMIGYDSEKPSGGFFMIFAGFALIATGVLLADSLILINTLTTPFGIFLCLLGGHKAFFKKKDTEEQT